MGELNVSTNTSDFFKRETHAETPILTTKITLTYQNGCHCENNCSSWRLHWLCLHGACCAYQFSDEAMAGVSWFRKIGGGLKGCHTIFLFF